MLYIDENALHCHVFSLADKDLYSYCCQGMVMRMLFIALLLILVACAPQAPGTPGAPGETAVPQISTREQVTSPAQPPSPVVREPEPVPVPLTPVENIEYEADPYSQLGCEKLLTAEDFASACGKEAGSLVVTYRIGTRNCFVNVKDRANERLTAGMTLTGYKYAEDAMEEFDRRLKVLKVGADKSVGERVYDFPAKLADREEMEFLRNEFIVKGGTDTRLCSKEGLAASLRIIDSRIK